MSTNKIKLPIEVFVRADFSHGNIFPMGYSYDVGNSWTNIDKVVNHTINEDFYICVCQVGDKYVDLKFDKDSLIWQLIAVCDTPTSFPEYN